MVRIEGRRVELAGGTDELAIDLLLLIRMLNDLKENNNELYVSLTENISNLIKLTTEAEEDVTKFLTNLHDLF